ncbi:MAG TPA: hypothetical protein IGR15_05805 [Synechococcus sp. M44_DOE_062]|nr:hypothetical protein [Synechococcus sp. M44_DOE_062]
MVGIFRRLFGSRGQAAATSSPETVAKPTPKKAKNDNTFFLDPDEAKTLGNIEYMRTPRIVKHTFQDFGSKEKVEVVEQVSSLSKVKLSTEQAKTPETASEQGSSTSSSGVSSRRQGGSDMDTFRNMARSLRRK